MPKQTSAPSTQPVDVKDVQPQSVVSYGEHRYTIQATKCEPGFVHAVRDDGVDVTFEHGDMVIRES